MNLKALFEPFPVLETPQLLLRALRPDDLDDLYAYASDPEIDRFTPWRHYQSRAEAAADLADYLQEYEHDGMGAWGIEYRKEQRLIGIASFSSPHPHHRRLELGLTIARSHWGRNLAAEAGRELVTFALQRMQMVRVEAVCLPDHLASARVLEKIGMRYEGLLHNYQVWRGRPRDLRMFAITI